MSRCVLIRYGELGLKGDNRPLFEEALRTNLERALAPVAPCPVERIWGRLLAGPLAAPAKAAAACARVFGVTSVSIAAAVPRTLEAIGATAGEMTGEWLAGRGMAPSSFKVACRRADKAFPLPSEEVARRVGGDLAAHFPALKARMEGPDLVVEVDIRDEAAYISVERIPGPGGLPVGTQGRALLLLSGGIDSPVAGWLALKRGVALEAIHFDSAPWTGPLSRGKVEDLARILSSWAGGMILHVVPFAFVQEAVKERCRTRYHTLLFRRMMHRIAQAVALERECLALVTGENLGQVASQTLANLALTNEVVRLPVIRPLVTYDKEQTVALAERIGTFAVSKLPYPDGCTFFSPRHPATRGRPEVVAEEEARLDVAEMVARAAGEREVMEA